MPRPAWPANHCRDIERSRQLLDEAASLAQASGANGVDHDRFGQIFTTGGEPMGVRRT
jgi:hypothetical protein